MGRTEIHGGILFMKHVSEVINVNSVKSPKFIRSEDNVDTRTIGITNHVFEQIQSIYPGFKACWGTDKEFSNAKINWAKAFMHSGITNINQINHAMKRCRLQETRFPPSCGEFIAWCMPEAKDLNLPSIDEAYDEAVKNSYRYQIEKKWSHIAIYNAWKLSGAGNLFNMPKKESFKLFEKNYNFVLKKIVNGELLIDLPLAISERPEPKITKTFGEDNLQKLKNSLR